MGQRQKRNAGVPFDFAQGGLLHCAMDDETVHRFGRDDALKYRGWLLVVGGEVGYDGGEEKEGACGGGEDSGVQVGCQARSG